MAIASATNGPGATDSADGADRDAAPARRIPPARVSPARRIPPAGGLALLCLAAVAAEAAADVLPDDPVAWVATPVRLVLLAGLAGVLLTGIHPAALRTPLDPWIAALLGAAAVATAAGRQDWSQWRGLLTAVAVYYLVVGVRRALPEVGAALGVLALVAVTVGAATAARQAAGGIRTGFCRDVLGGAGDSCGPAAVVRAVGTFANPNLLAAFLVLLLPVAAVGVASLADRHTRLVGAALVGLGYLAVLLTASRGGVLAALAGVAAAVVLHRPSPRRLLLAGAASVSAMGLLVGLSAGSVGVRADVWTAALHLAAGHPLGVGLGRAGAEIDAAVAGSEPFAHAHNLWLNWAVEAGLPGLLAAAGLTVAAGVLAVRCARRGSLMAIAVGAGLAGFAVMSLADHPAAASRVSLALWLVLGLLATETAPRWWTRI